MRTAYVTIRGFEVMRVLKKQQAKAFNFTGDIKGEIRITERPFGLGNMMTLLENNRDN